MATLSVTYNGTTTNLPEPSSYEPSYYDVDASTSGRNAAGVMMRDVVRQNVRKVNCKWSALKQSEMQTIMNAISHQSFTLNYLDPFDGAVHSMTCYAGDRSSNVYWMPSSAASSWMVESFSVNFIEV